MQVRSADDIRTVLRTERRRRGLTQSQLADLTGTSQKWISDFERGRVDPPLSIVLKVLVLLGVGIDLAPPVLSQPDEPDQGEDF